MFVNASMQMGLRRWICADGPAQMACADGSVLMACADINV